MAHIRRHPVDHSKWQVRYRDPLGRERSRTFDRKVDAQRFADTVAADLHRDEWTDPKEGSIRFADWAAEVDRHQRRRRQSTKDRDASLIRSMIVPEFGEVPINKITRAMVEHWLDRLIDAEYAPATIRKAFQLLGKPLRIAAEEGRIRHSPTDRVQLPSLDQQERRFLTVEEIESIAEAIDPRYRAMVLLAAASGARFGELAALRRSRLDLRRRVLVVDSSADANGQPGPPKTPAGRRTIRLPGWILPILRDHLVNNATDELVFPSPRGKPLRRSLFRSRVWIPAIRASVGEPCPFHSLRHSHAALLIEQGVHSKAIQARLGHGDIRTTLQLYGHLFEGYDETAAEAMDSAFADNTRTRPARNVVSLDRPV